MVIWIGSLVWRWLSTTLAANSIHKFFLERPQLQKPPADPGPEFYPRPENQTQWQEGSFNGGQTGPGSHNLSPA